MFRFQAADNMKDLTVFNDFRHDSFKKDVKKIGVAISS